MAMISVRFHVICLAEDPQGPARVLGVFAARSLLPWRYLAERTADVVSIEIGLHLDEGDTTDPTHLARVLRRIATVEAVDLKVDGRSVAFEPHVPAWTGRTGFL